MSGSRLSFATALSRIILFQSTSAASCFPSSQVGLEITSQTKPFHSPAAPQLSLLSPTCDRAQAARLTIRPSSGAGARFMVVSLLAAASPLLSRLHPCWPIAALAGRP
ncbi:hypothetical protein V8C44DRAFT_315889 [Trichoderma aethiopicum]